MRLGKEWISDWVMWSSANRLETYLGGVVRYDFGKTVGQGIFERIGSLNKPPPILLTAIARSKADQMVETSQILKHLAEMIATYPISP